MKIVFFSNQLSERGTETALIDYAYGNKEILMNESILAFPASRIYDSTRYENLKKDFSIMLVENIEDFEKDLLINNIDLLYIITDGKSYDIADQIKKIKTFVHCVFSTERQHGTYYCAIHDYLNKFYHSSYPVLPHIVKKLPDTATTLRKELKIPNEAIVFGSYGGKNSFNIKYAHEAIKKVAENNPHTFFVFMNIDNFLQKKYNISLPNVIFLPGSTDAYTKSRFISTCDAMIHARWDGETFGLSVAEFACFNKPIITYTPDLLNRIKYFIKSRGNKRLFSTYSRAHLINLGKSAIIYKNTRQLIYIFSHLYEFYDKNTNYDCFSETFSSQNVMKQFEKIINS